MRRWWLLLVILAPTGATEFGSHELVRSPRWEPPSAQITEVQGVTATPPPSSVATPRKFMVANEKSISLMFFLFAWRAIHNFQIADATTTGARIFLVVPALALLFGNLGGLMITSASSGEAMIRRKKQLRNIFHADRLTEAALLAFNVLKLVQGDGVSMPKDRLLARSYTNFLLLVLLQQVVKAQWISGVPHAMLAAQQQQQQQQHQQQQQLRQQQQQQQQQQPVTLSESQDAATPYWQPQTPTPAAAPM